MPMRITKNQRAMRKDTTDYTGAYFKHGTVTVALSAGENDYYVNTGIAKFTNGVICGGVNAEWVGSSWSYISRGFRSPEQGASNIQFWMHSYTAGPQNVTIRWWALGY